jgi:hypothetical protein
MTGSRGLVRWSTSTMPPCWGTADCAPRQLASCADRSWQHPWGELRLLEVPSHAALHDRWVGVAPNCVHVPSEITSTQPSTTTMAVCSSMA